MAGSATGGVWGGEGTLNVGRAELVAASGAWSRCQELDTVAGFLSGAGSFGVSAGSVLESRAGAIHAGLATRGTLRTSCLSYGAVLDRCICVCGGGDQRGDDYHLRGGGVGCRSGGRMVRCW